ncbi:hypothetical protein LPJ75_006515 [Coemansia sp. RSA 2598]|nr:hypothetical protein LPJ75_006515 [Coemansia sp. RSA 2598]
MGADAVALDRSKLSAEERRFLETIERFTDDDEDDDEDQDEVDDQSELEDDGDAFSDEDRANAARDDDEDDYNDSDYDRSDDGDDDGPPTRSTVVERVFESQPPSSQPAAPSPQQPKSILKQKPASSLFKRRLAEQKHPDDDDSAGPTRSVRFDASANTTHTLPRQDAAAESAVQQAADLMGELQVEDRAAKKHAPLVFKPNVAAVSRVRSQPPNNAAHPMKRAVVERDSAAMTELPTLESVDDDLHAKEIVQAYARMRHARLATGKLDGAAEIAERVLGATPGVTLVDRAGGQGSGAPEDADDQGFERIELAGDPSPLNMAHAAPHPPEVVHQDAPRPKMSRFKAKRLGLEE